jgi:acetyl esterase/lipase
LAPEHPFPAAVDDCYAALSWTAAGADDLGIDRSRVGVGGVSAGGGLAAAVALMTRDRGVPVVAFQMLIFPVLDDRMATASMAFVDTPLFDGPAAARMWSSYLDANRSSTSPYAAPARAEDLRGLPPTYLATGEFDPLRDEGISYALRLLAAEVSVELHNFAGTFHTFDVFPTAISKRAANEQVEWLRRIADLLKDSVPKESLRQSTDGAST